MVDNNEITMNGENFEPHKETIVKWVHFLFLCQIAKLFITALGTISVINDIAGWVSRLISFATVFALFKLSVVNARYRKATIFYGIFIGGSILSLAINMNMFALVLSICSIVASYQELNAHSEITASKDAKLSARWHSLFYLDMFAGIMVGVVSIIPMIIAAFAGVDTNLLISIFSIVLALINIVLGLLHVVYLKKTVVLYRD